MWEILGIEPTTNEKEITNAYRNLLLKANPEEDPEGFKQLRKAYEEALQYAKSRQQTSNPIDQWVNCLEDLYNHFQDRIHLEKWEELLADPLLDEIGTKGLIEDRLLQFFTNHYQCIPHQVWLLLDQQFDLINRLEELYDKYPEDYVNYVIRDGILYNDIMPFDYFQPGQDGEIIPQYISLYREIIHMNPEEREGILAQLDALSEKHPYGQCLIYEYQINNGNKEAIECIKELADHYPDSSFLIHRYLDNLLTIEEYDQLETLCNHYLEMDPEDITIHFILSQVYGKRKEYKNAIDKINDIMTMVRGDDGTLRNLNQARSDLNVLYIEELEAIKEPTQQNLLDLCWAYLQNELDEKAFNLSKQLDVNELDEFDYYNLMSYIHITQEDYEVAVNDTNKVIDIISHLEDDGTKKTRKRLKRLIDMKNRRIEIYIQMKHYDDALYYIEQSIQENPKDIDAYRALCVTHLYTKDYQALQQAANQYIALAKENYSGYLFLATALFNLGDDRGAYEANETAMSIYSYDLRLYTLKARILIHNDAFEPAKQILQIFENNGFNTDLNYYYIQGLLQECEEKNDAKAIEYYEEAIKQKDRLDDEDYSADLYYRLLTLKGRILDMREEENRHYMLDLCEYALSYDPNHIFTLDYKAWLLVKEKRYQDALPIYLQLQQLPVHPLEVEEQLVLIYYQDIEQNAKICLDLCLYILEKQEEQDPEIIFKAGMCEMYMNQLDAACTHFEQLEEFNWKVDSYYRRSQVYLNQEDLPNALKYALLTLEEIKNREQPSKHFQNIVHIYLRMEDYHSAIDFILQYSQHPAYKTAMYDLYTVYMQAGYFDELIKLVKKWTKQGQTNVLSIKELYTLYKMSNHPRKASAILMKEGLTKGSIKYYETLYQSQENSLNFAGAIKSLHTLIRLRKNAGYQDLTIEYSHLALCYEMEGKQKQKMKYATLAKEMNEQKLALPFLRDKTLYVARQGNIEALLGNYDLALQYLSEARCSPKCDFCQYHACRDADYFEVVTLLLKHQYNEAMEKALQYSVEWKDDFDFYTIINIIQAKQK